MRTDLTSRIAAVMLVAIFLSNDVLATTNAIFSGIPIRQPLTTEIYTGNILPSGFESSQDLEPMRVLANTQVAYLGGHPNDVRNQSQDDVFDVQLDFERGQYQYAYLSYEVKGVENADEVPKSINGKAVYGGAILQPSTEWTTARVRIALDDLVSGINSIRFSVPEGISIPIEVKNVSVELRREENENLEVQHRFTRIPASTLDFEVLTENTDLVGFKVGQAEVASIPNHIFNVTRKSHAYHLDGENHEGYHIAIGIDPSRLRSHSEINEVQVFFFDNISKNWKQAHKVKVDRENLRVEAMVPGETDYFAGLIEAPEMPEASAFVPTNISDVEPANPATGMRLMQAPSINRTGSASINYPLWIPEGRNGMTPPLSVSYNSDAGTGWLGMGWSIGNSSISVDTKWGVPTYDNGIESEPYVLDGEALFQEGGFRPNNPVLDQSGAVVTNRRTAGRSLFFPRVQHSYQVIERLGNGTTDYYWKVTDASKTVKYYGTSDGTRVDENAVLRSGSSGPIAQWLLKKVVDQWGNTIDYEYTHYSNSSSNTMKSGGKGVYLSRIVYTGYNSDPGKYEIKFLASGERPDGTVNMNYGFKVIDDRQLDDIEVLYDRSLLVTYHFNYKNGQSTFFKSLLEYISEIRGGSEFYRHTMEYYDDIGLTYNSTPEILSIDHGQSHLSDAPWYVRSILNPLYNSITPSPLSTSLTEGSSGHGTIGIGLSGTFLGVTFDKTSSINIGLSGSKSWTETMRQMQDMNGDGIQDMLMDAGDRVFYRPITRNDNGTLRIGTPIRVHTNGFSSSVSSSFGGKVELVGPKASGPVQVGINYSRNKSETLRSITDYNADGFPDLIYRSGSSTKVLFGDLQSNGEYRFRGSSEDTYNPVIRGVNVITPPDDDFKKPMEIVKVWEAFEDGSVQITGSASIATGASGTVDVALQHNGTIVAGGFHTITPTSSHNYNQTIGVNKGDILMFRSRSANDGQGDLLNWNPRVEYTSGDKLDGQNTAWGHSNGQDGFVLSSLNGVTIDGNRGFRVDMNYSNEVEFSDDVNLFIDVYVNGVHEDTYSEPLSDGTVGSPGSSFAPFVVGNPSLSGYYTVSSADEEDLVTLKFRVASSSNVDWNALLWLPIVELDPACNDPINTHYPVPEYQTFNKLDLHKDEIDLGGLDPEEQYQLLPNITVHTSDIQEAITEEALPKGVVYMTLKKEGRLVQKIAIEFDRNTPTLRLKNVDMLAKWDPLDYTFVGSTTLSKNAFTYAAEAIINQEHAEDGTVKVEFFAKGPYAEAMTQYIQNHLNSFDLYSDRSGLVDQFDPEEASYFYQKYNELEMHYKHWGVFSWSPLDGEENEPINPEDLHFPLQGFANQDPENYDLGAVENNPGQYNSEDFEFWQLTAIRGENDRDFWGYQDDLISETRDKDRYSLAGHHLGMFRLEGAMNPMIIGEVDLSYADPSIDAGSFNPSYTAVGTLGRGRAHTLSINGGVSQVSGSVNISDPLVFYSSQKALFADLNGDGYPDILTDDNGIKGQFTNMTGGYTSQTSVANISTLSKGTSLGANVSWAGAYGNEDARFRVSGSISGSMTFSKSRTQTIDVNGDGLPDAFEDNISNDRFRLGFGKGFESNHFTPQGTIRYQAYSAAVGGTAILSNFASSFSKYVKSISAGLNINVVGNYSEQFYFDFNGDGLMDYVDLSGNDALWLNTGSGYQSYTLASNAIVPINENINKSGNTGISAQFTLTLGPIISFLKLPISGGYGDNFSINRMKTSFMDMNGDGAPDYVHAENGDLKVYYAQFGKANKLKKVTNPLKGTFTIDYEVVGNKRGYYDPVIRTHLSETENERMLWDMPNAKWVMSSLIIYDGLNVTNGTTDLDGVDYFETKFAYDGGVRLRKEREFAGFTRIATIQPNQLDILEDYCKSSAHFDVENQRDVSGLYTHPYLAGIDGQELTQVEALGRFNMLVMEYVSPTSLNPDAMKGYLYDKDIQIHNYSLHVHTWKDSVSVYEDLNPPMEPSFSHYDSWTHEHIELISDEGVDYELRMVETGVARTESMAPVGQVINEEEDNWLLVEDLYASNNVPEYLTVFPAVTDKRNINFPVIEDRDGINIQKYHIKYDNYFNVVWYEDFGTLLNPQIDTIYVDTIYVGRYDTIHQVNDCSGMNEVDIDGVHYYVWVPSTTAGYENDTIDGIYSYSSSCGNYPGIGPLADCANTGGGDNGTFMSTHRKWIVEETYVIQLVDASTYDRRIIATMDYFDPIGANGRTNALEEHKIYAQNTSTSNNMRRFTKVELLDAGKAPSQIAKYLSSSTSGAKAVTNLVYDNYGNVTSVEGPANHANQRATTTYSYDASVHQFVERIDDAYGEFNCRIYDLGFQQLLQSTSTNGHIMRYTYDANRRPLHIWAPREYYTPTNGPTISYSYSPSAATPVAYTYHNTGNKGTGVTYGSAGTGCDALTGVSGWETTMTTKVETATFTDGLDKVVQVQTYTDWDDPATSLDHTMSTKVQVSGWSSVNEFGSSILVRNDFLVSSGNFGSLQNHASDAVATQEYDWLNRVFKTETAWSTTNPSSSWAAATVTRSWQSLGTNTYFTESTDQDGKSISTLYLDHRGKQVATTVEGNAWAATSETTLFDYNDMYQLAQVEDPSGLITYYEYDFFGRVVQQVHPDRDTIKTVYDPASNLIEIYTVGTEESVAGGFVEMEYNYNRLESKLMPLGSSNEDLYNVHYVYGTRGDGNNGASRILTVTQGNVANPVLLESFKYDELGQIVQSTRTIDVPQVGVKTYTTKFRFDSFGRMLRATYPGNENLNYEYSDLGALTAIDVNYQNCGNIPELIDEISYDGYGNIVYMEYGNGTEMEFGYHSITRALLSSDVKATPNGYSYQEVMDRQYEYNSLGMVSQSEITPHRSFMSTASKLTTTFTYDGLLRLKKADTDISAASYSLDDEPTPAFFYFVHNGNMYDVDMTYLSAGRIASKHSNPTTTTPSLVNGNLDYNMTYTYDATKKHQLVSTSEATPYGTANSTFEYNTSGSMTRISRDLNSNTIGSIRMLWNEEQQMIADSNDRGIHHYIYDYAGERLMKSSYTLTSSWQNDNALSSSGSLDAYTVYTSPYVVKSYYDDNGTMKDETTYHYYMGMQRVASGRFGKYETSGELPDPDPDPEFSETKVAAPNGGNTVLNQMEEVLSEFGLSKGVDFTRAELEKPVPLSAMYPEHTSNGKMDDQESPDPTGRQAIDEEGGSEQQFCPGLTTEVYWYHPNYLGSVDLVTDVSGAVHQFFLYNAWGENMNEYNAQAQGFDSPYRFNAKELDDETGLAYYGARYYQNRLSLWLSVDRLAEKYPYSSPYVFSGSNPVTYVDPNGDSLAGVSDLSAKRMLTNIKNTFVGERFDKLNALFELDDDGRTMKHIDESSFNEAISGLSDKEKALARGYYGVINDDEMHKVEIVTRDEMISSDGLDILGSLYSDGASVDEHSGGGRNVPTSKGSYSVIVKGSTAEIDDYVSVSSGNTYSRRSTQAELQAHEVIGHGYGRYHGGSSLDAIRVTNLFWAVQGFGNVMYRHGETHGRRMNQADATSTPLFLR